MKRAWFAGLVAAVALSGAGQAMAATHGAAAFAARPVDGGLELRRGETVLRIVALRPDVVRVRLGRAGVLPPDESWAALAGPRDAHVAVTSCGRSCFATAVLRVEVDPATGALTLRDPDGRVRLQQLKGAVQPQDSGFRLSFAEGADAHYFGLGDKVGPLDRRGRLFSLWNTDAYRYQESTDPLYKAIPFFLQVDDGETAGIFLDNTWRSVFDFGAERPGVVSFGADDGPVDYYLVAGPTPKDVLSAYAWLTGAPPLPPLWAFGFQQSRYSYGSEAEAREVADRLRADRIPADVIWFDIGALDDNRAFTIAKDRFPDFRRFVGELGRQGFKTVVITDLHLAAQPGYAPYDSGEIGDRFVRLANGKTYIGKVWPGPSVFPEFTQASTRAWWGSLFKDLYDRDGVAGFWNDMNEPSVFDTASHTMPPEVRHRIGEPGFAPRIATHAEIHNVYGMLNSEATYGGMLALKPDQRPFVMTRATYAGGQRYVVTWTGDNSATWNHLRLSTPQLLSLGLSGFAFAGDDLGGFAGSPPTDLLTRWLELDAFNPIARDHSAKGTARHEPWVGGPDAEAIRRRFIETRYRLLPYIYTAAEATARTGVPLMRPLFVEFPKAAAGRPLDLDAPSEFMLGPDLLVAPSPWPESPEPYDVLLPPGDWYDFWTGAKVAVGGAARSTGAGGATAALAGDAAAAPRAIQVTPALDRLPVYVRAGAIVPRQPLVQSTAETPQGPLTLDVYPGPDCQGEVYADDGVTRAYLKGASFRQRFACSVTPDGVEVRFEAPTGAYKPWWTSVRVAVHSAAPLRLVTGASPETDGDAQSASAEPGIGVAVMEAAPYRPVTLRFTVNR